MNINDIRDSLVTCGELMSNPPNDDLYKIMRDVQTRIDECVSHLDRAVETEVYKQIKGDD